MDTVFSIAAFLGALIGAVWLIPVIRRVAFAQGWVDEPDGKRKLHKQATPAMGGLAIALGVVVGMLLLYAAGDLLNVPSLSPLFWAGALLMVGTGFADDLLGIGAKKKFLVQLVAAYLLMHAGYRLDLAALPFFEALPAYDLALYTMPLTIVWIVGIINAVNLIDGLDGLAGGLSLIALAALGVLFSLHAQPGMALLMLPFIGAVLGFLWFNFNPATIFMGDTGSLLLGYVLAAFSLQGLPAVEAPMALLVPVMILGIPIADTSMSMVRRMLAGKSMFSPDHDHMHHRLEARFTVRGAVSILYAAALLLGVAGITLSYLTVADGLVLFFSTALLGASCLWSMGYLRGKGLRRVARARALKAERRELHASLAKQSISTAAVPSTSVPDRERVLHDLAA